MSFRHLALAWIAWFGNRLAAAVVGAALLGLAISTAMNAYADLTGGPPGPGADLLGGYISFGIYFAMGAVILGTIPGTLVLCVSRARYHPWRSLPRLLLGAAIGFLIVAVPFLMHPGTGVTLIVTFIVTFIGPSAGGTIASFTIPRLQESGC